MTLSHPIVFLLDVDNTLLDNDGIQQDLKDHLERAYGRDARDRYWRILAEEPVLGNSSYARRSRSIATLSRRASLRSRAPGDVILSDRLSIRGPSVPSALARIEAAKGFRTDRYLVRWGRRFSAAQGRASGPVRRGRRARTYLYP